MSHFQSQACEMASSIGEKSITLIQPDNGVNSVNAEEEGPKAWVERETPSRSLRPLPITSEDLGQVVVVEVKGLTRTDHSKSQNGQKAFEDLQTKLAKKETDFVLALQTVCDLSTKLTQTETLLHEKDRLLANFEKEIGKLREENRKMKTRLETLTEKTVDLHRYFNRSVRDHFYTTDWTELGGGKNGYVYEGVVGSVLSSPVEGSVPLFRYWNDKNGDHHYTTNWMELCGGFLDYECWRLEGICCYIFPTPEEGTRPLFRYFNSEGRDHFFTTNWGELGWGQDGYVGEQVAGYLY